MKSLEEIVPGFGVDQETFEVYIRNSLIPYGKSFDNIMGILSKMQKLTLNGTKQVSSLLLFGPQGTGKSSIATHFAQNSQFSYVKIISP